MSRVARTSSKPIRWVETSSKVTCPACGGARYCSISECGTLALCRRGAESAHPVKQKDKTIAYLHKVADIGSVDRKKIGKAKPAVAKLSTTEIAALLKRHRTALSPARLSRTARSLGLSEKSLKRVGIGYADDFGCVSFPMYDGSQKPVGIRLRHDDGRKLCVPGSRNGLFIPEDYDVPKVPPALVKGDEHPLLLMMPEGPTDTAAAMDFGFRAIGRPNDKGGADYALDLLRSGDKQEVVIVADYDREKFADAFGGECQRVKRLKTGEPHFPGYEGALTIAQTILPVCGTLKLIQPPDKHKDLREYLRDDGSDKELFAAIASAARIVPDKDYMRIIKDKKLSEDARHVTTLSQKRKELEWVKAQIVKRDGGSK